jgi:hypothetical protein
VTLAFFTLVLLAFSDEPMSAMQQIPAVAPRRWWIYLLFEVVVLTLLYWQRHRIRKAMDLPRAWPVGLWWFGGATLMLCSDARWVGLRFPAKLPQPWEDVLEAGISALAVLILLATTIGANPLMLVASRFRKNKKKIWKGLRAAIPLMVGIFFAYLASMWWDRSLEPTSNDGSSTVDVQFFAQASQVLPLLIVALGYEIGTFREAMRRPAQRASAIVSLVFLCVGEVLALSVLIHPSDEAGTTLTNLIAALRGKAPAWDLEFSWHIYSAFVVVTMAGLIGLATLVGALLAEGRARKKKKKKSPPKEKTSTPNTTAVTNKTRLPKWLDVAAVGVIAIAVAVATRKRD